MKPLHIALVFAVLLSLLITYLHLTLVTRSLGTLALLPCRWNAVDCESTSSTGFGTGQGTGPISLNAWTDKIVVSVQHLHLA